MKEIKIFTPKKESDQERYARVGKQLQAVEETSNRFSAEEDNSANQGRQPIVDDDMKIYLDRYYDELLKKEGGEKIKVEIESILKYIDTYQNKDGSPNERNIIPSKEYKTIFERSIANQYVYKGMERPLSSLINDLVGDDTIELVCDDELPGKEYATQVRSTIEPYFSFIKDLYIKGDFQQRNNIENYLQDIYGTAMISGMMNTKPILGKIGKEILEIEKQDSGNHYIYLHIASLVENKKDFFDTKKPVAPREYIAQAQNGTIFEYYISQPGQFEELTALSIEESILVSQLESVEKTIQEKQSNQENGNNVFIYPKIVCQQKPTDPDCVNYTALAVKLDNIREVKDKFFDTRLSDFLKEHACVRGKSSLDVMDDQQFMFFQTESIRESFQKRSSVSLTDLTLAEQFYFFEYTKNLKNSEANTLYDFTKKYEVEGMRTFLSLGQGGEQMGAKIMTLGEKLPGESAKILFKKYSEIVDEVNKITTFLSDSLGGHVDENIIQSAQNHLLNKGRDLLAHYADKANKCVDQECEELGHELELKLANIKTSLLLFASVCKSLSEEKKLSLEDLADTELDIIRGGIEQITQDEMLRIFKENRPHYPSALLADTVSEFENSLTDQKENQTWYILRHKGDIASFMRLDDQEDGSIYGASFNVRTELRGSSIGSELLKKIIEEKSRTKPFKIVCYDKNPMLEKYKEDFGFTVTRTIQNYHNTGETFYELIRSPESKQ